MSSTWFAASTNGERRASRRRFVPRLEPLEARTLPSTITVLNLADSGEGSLRQAILDANSPAYPGADVINFADGLQDTIALTTGQLSITDDLTIDGPGADRLAVSGNHQSRIFGISGGVTVVIAGLTITDGMAVGDGGGILNTGGTLALAHVVLSYNQAVGAATAPGVHGQGGAVANLEGATLTVTDSLFAQNQALGGLSSQGNGGAIANQGSHLSVSRSTFTRNLTRGGTGRGNTNTRAGGIDNVEGSTAVITDCAFTDNQAIGADGGEIGYARGGGIYNNDSTASVIRSTFSGNKAIAGSHNTGTNRLLGLAFGGAIGNSDLGRLVVTGSTFTNNQAIGGSNNTSTGGIRYTGVGTGGALLNVGEATVTDSTFEHNEARGGSGNRGSGASPFVGIGWGGAIKSGAGGFSGGPSRLTLDNVTLRHNRAVGGDSNTAGIFLGAAWGGGLAISGENSNDPVSGGSITMVRNCMIAHNQVAGGAGAEAQGGGIANHFGGVLTVEDSTLTHNRALGGDGGNGLGGGLYNGAASTHPSNPGAPTVLRLERSTVTENHANGGEGNEGASDGEGVGGGVYNLGSFDLDALTQIFKNYASTNDDDVFDSFA
jgi:hypothetical protein